ncbi:hypothetical protein [Streptomyces sp. B21-108]|uniref:hypothetical protein n=1 Tax=Streptomyces sp. B21-108 TaxID=3039419 RepID=UPI003FA7CD31
MCWSRPDRRPAGALARFAAGIDAVQRVDVLPFHKLGAPQYDALGIPFPLRDTPVPDPAPTESVRACLRARGVSAY